MPPPTKNVNVPLTSEENQPTPQFRAVAPIKTSPQNGNFSGTGTPSLSTSKSTTSTGASIDREDTAPITWSGRTSRYL
ncbi:hypothetical protein [Cylindrospermopsis raciborskii]|uniref:hypothetical protein n=1 Tax=Cylindrospermopsis raciborskii TaxID=77022 RepID=UPI00277B58A3|nr:hypothetical protein [Cylindrospermopsis raciborskii]